MERLKPSEFKAAPPEKISIGAALKKGYSTLTYFIALLFGVYDNNPQNPTNFSSTNPSGKITEGHFALCQHIYDEAKERDEKLTNKATSTLSTIAILVPLILSALVYIGTATAIKPWCHRIIITVISISLVFLLMAFIAAFRVLFIRGAESLYLESIIDLSKQKIKEYSLDIHGRGLLWCASKNTAMSDHKADFIRASHLFVTLSVILLLLSATPLIYTLSPEAKIQKIKGDVQVTSKSIESLLVDIKNEMKSSHSNSADNEKLQKQIETLNQQMLQMEKDVKDIRKVARKP